MENFANKIREYMNKNNVTQRDFALSVKIDRARISRILNGQVKPSKNDIIKLKEFFDGFNKTTEQKSIDS